MVHGNINSSFRPLNGRQLLNFILNTRKTPSFGSELPVEGVFLYFFTVFFEPCLNAGHDAHNFMTFDFVAFDHIHDFSVFEKGE